MKINDHRLRTAVRGLALTVCVACAAWSHAQLPVRQPPVPSGPKKAGVMNVRLVRVFDAPQGGTVDPALNDVLPLLRANLRYKSYRLASDRNFVLTPGAAQPLDQGFHVTVENIESLVMTVNIFRHQNQLMRTRLKLQPKRPLVVGPFREGNSAFILIFTLTS